MADQALDLNIDGSAGRFVTPALRQRIESIALGTATITLLLVVWELLPHVLPIQQGTRLFFTVPSRIFETLWQMFATGTIWMPLGVSATAFTIGLVLAIAVGLPLGILLGRSATGQGGLWISKRPPTGAGSADLAATDARTNWSAHSGKDRQRPRS